MVLSEEKQTNNIDEIIPLALTPGIPDKINKNVIPNRNCNISPGTIREVGIFPSIEMLVMSIQVSVISEQLNNLQTDHWRWGGFSKVNFVQ